MNQYNFDEETSRKNTNSLKWDVAENELPMWVADMDFATAPCIQNAVVERAKRGIFGYTVVPDEWYNSIIGWWQNRHSFTIEKKSLCFTTGIVPAISSIVKRITNVGDNILLQTPVYDIFFHSVENAGRHVLENKLTYREGVYAIDFDDLEEKLSRPLTTMMILCNPHNPVGKIFTKEELAKIGELCKKYSVTVLSDEIHCDVVAPGKQYIPFASVSEACKNNSVTCISASKAFNVAGLQSAAVFADDEGLRNKIVRGLNSDEVAEPNCFAVDSTIAAFSKEGEQWLDEARDYLFENKATVQKFIEENIPELSVVKGDATYLVWIDCSSLTNDSESLRDFIRARTGLYMSAGSEYRGNGNEFLRLNAACRRALLQEGLNRLKRAVEEYRTK